MNFNLQSWSARRLNGSYIEGRLRAAVELGAAGNQNLVRSHTFKQKHTSRWYRSTTISIRTQMSFSCPLRRRGESDARVKVAQARACVGSYVFHARKFLSFDSRTVMIGRVYVQTRGRVGGSREGRGRGQITATQRNNQCSLRVITPPFSRSSRLFQGCHTDRDSCAIYCASFDALPYYISSFGVVTGSSSGLGAERDLANLTIFSSSVFTRATAKNFSSLVLDACCKYQLVYAFCPRRRKWSGTWRWNNDEKLLVACGWRMFQTNIDSHKHFVHAIRGIFALNLKTIFVVDNKYTPKKRILPSPCVAARFLFFFDL